MTDEVRTIGDIVRELRSAKVVGGLRVEVLHRAGIASVQAFMADMGARGYKLELNGAGDRVKLIHEPRVGAAKWKRRQGALFEMPRRGPYDEAA